MNKITLLSIAVIALILVNLALIFTYRPHPPGPKQHGEMVKKTVIEQLKLNDQQIAQYENLILDHRSKIQSQERNLKDARSHLYDLLRQDDLGQRDSLTQVVSNTQKAIEQIHFEHFTAIKALCTSEQRPRFDALTGELAQLFSPQKKGR